MEDRDSKAESRERRFDNKGIPALNKLIELNQDRLDPETVNRLYDLSKRMEKEIKNKKKDSIEDSNDAELQHNTNLSVTRPRSPRGDVAPP
jgi:hypothetical protein